MTLVGTIISMFTFWLTSGEPYVLETKMIYFSDSLEVVKIIMIQTNKL